MPRESYDQDGYPCNPRILSDSAWYYEQKSGIEVYYMGHKITLGWRHISRAAENHKKAQRRKSK